jgi:hypothetical protein
MKNREHAAVIECAELEKSAPNYVGLSTDGIRSKATR